VRRYWFEAKDKNKDGILLEGDNFQHICKVCRLDEGDQFEALFGDGQALVCEITSRSKKSAQAKLVSTRTIQPLARPHLVLALSIPKYPKLDFIVEKAVELGVERIQPFVSDRSFIRDIDNSLLERLDRGRRIVESATEQCGRGDLMPILPPVNLDQVLESFNRTSGAKGLFLYEGSAQASLKEHLQSSALKATPSEIWCFVGSEGGFSREEAERLQAAGLPSLTLGTQVLRVETACVVVLGILKYEFDLMRNPSKGSHED
jgi:16S rRNA (uracil1498-N3)-methyltransferase